MAAEPVSSVSDVPFLDTVQGEIAYFRAIMQARPVGINRHFHMIAVQRHITEATGHAVAVEDLWNKLETLYDIEALESMDISEPDESPPTMTIPLPGSSRQPQMTPLEIREVIFHPHFRSEFALPMNEFESLMASRRLRDGASSADESTAKPAKSLARSKSRNAGLVSGDSESSELTEGDGDIESSRIDDSGDPSPTSRRARGSKPTRARRGLAANRARTAAATEAKRRKKR